MKMHDAIISKVSDSGGLVIYLNGIQKLIEVDRRDLLAIIFQN